MRSIIGAAVLALALGACMGEKPSTDTATAGTPATPPPAGGAAGGTQTPDAGGQVIVVEMITDGTGNFYKPAEITAKRGDVVRYTLTTGVHNVNFLPDSNPKGVTLPKTSDLLQLPGQTYDVKVELPAGKYYFHCDPHVALGMKGHITVQ